MTTYYLSNKELKQINMEKLTYEQILAKLQESGMSLEEFAYEDYDSEELGLGEVEEIHQEGGEGQGDHWESVKYFKDHDVYIKITGFYSSYEGTEFESWDDCENVRPKTVEVVVYE